MSTNETINSYIKLIERYAQVALKKIRKPANCNLDDLIQEGAIAFLHAKKNYVNKGASFKTFLTRCLRNHFADLVKRSYRNREVNNVFSWNSLQENNSSKEAVLINKKDTTNTFEIVQVSFIIEDFNNEELSYINAILSFTHKHRRSRRKAAREVLTISYEREMELRRSIHDKIKK